MEELFVDLFSYRDNLEIICGFYTQLDPNNDQNVSQNVSEANNLNNSETELAFLFAHIRKINI